MCTDRPPDPDRPQDSAQESERSLQVLLESLLFVSDGPVTLRRLAQVLDATVEELEEAAQGLARACRDRGIRLQRHGESLQLVTAPEASAYVERLLGSQQTGKLSPAALETLAIIAYQQPVTRSTIEAIRGVNSDRVLSTLEARGLVCEVGRQETVGRPVLFGTTFEFLQYFGLESLEQLPPLEKKVDEDSG